MKIKKLSQQDIIKIAAGEVIERPAHALKELIENSIDAGATQITINLTHGGKSFIKITDNGCGMSEQDALIAFLPHTTSKISGIADLESVTSFGFRGEALASMAAVSTVTITTNDGSVQSTKLVIQQGNIIEQTIASHQQGTTISINDLFSFLPARKKFLKKDETELHACITIFQAFCLAYPHIHFKLFHNDGLLFNCASTYSIKTRTLQVWPNIPESQLHEINTTQHEVILSGITSNPLYQKYDRSFLYIFVNNRFIKNQHLLKAILKGYQGILPPQKFPVCVLKLQVPTQQIDVNIHPKKEEILFTQPHALDKIITGTIQTSISALRATPVLTYTNTEQSFTQSISPTVSSSQEKKVTLPESFFKNEFNATPIKNFTIETNIEKNKTVPTKPETQVPVFVHEQYDYELLGQYKQTYILIQKNDDLILIDQHAAHERILYEQYKKATEPHPSIRLLFPHMITVTQLDADLLEPHFNIFAHHGITLERFSDTQLCLYATPVGTKNEQLSEIIHACIAHIKKENIEQILHETLYAQLACASAIKAGQALTRETMNTIVQQLVQTPNYQTCPHGRPTHIAFFEKDITKYFKRDYTHKKIDYEHNIL